ncbi:MAG: GntR family transcriptional regulator [Anaerolineales bacterium]|jgi:DNA-binding GntR family transcriptional regulator
MDLIEVDTQKAYRVIKELITTLEIKPGSAIDESELSASIGFGSSPVREALKLLYHDQLVVVSQQGGIYIAGLNPSDLKMLSEVRVRLEGQAASLAAARATEDHLLVMDALVHEQGKIKTDDKVSYFDLDHKLHQAIAKASGNHYLAHSLEKYFNLSQRLWYLALPKLDFLSAAVEEHVQIIDSIRAKDSHQAEIRMNNHVQGFYQKVQNLIEI